MNKFALGLISTLLLSATFFSCKKQESKSQDNSKKNSTVTKTTETTKTVTDEQIQPESVIATEESLQKNYVLIEEKKFYTDGVFDTQRGKIYTLSNNKIGNPKLKYKTFLFNSTENTNTLLCESKNFGLSENDDYVEIDENFIIRFYHEPGLKLVDLYDYEKKNYVHSGYEGKLDLQNHILTLLLDSPLNLSDEQKVSKDFLSFNIDGLSSSQIASLQKVYLYKINYLTNKSSIIKGDFILKQQ